MCVVEREKPSAKKNLLGQILASANWKSFFFCEPITSCCCVDGSNPTRPQRRTDPRRLSWQPFVFQDDDAADVDETREEEEEQEEQEEEVDGEESKVRRVHQNESGPTTHSHTHTHTHTHTLNEEAIRTTRPAWNAIVPFRVFNEPASGEEEEEEPKKKTTTTRFRMKEKKEMVENQKKIKNR